MALRQPIPCSNTLPSPSCSRELRSSFGPIHVGRARPEFQMLSAGFSDRSHVQYYESGPGPLMSGKLDKKVKDKPLKKKKQLKLLKGLTRDLSTFSKIGFGLESDGLSLLDQVKSDMISEATEQLLERLQKIRAEEKELKRKAKQEKARLKAARIQTLEMSSSSSSSSDSSDSECGEVIDMKCANNKTVGLQQVLEEATNSIQEREKIDLGPNTLVVNSLGVDSWSNVDRTTDTLGEMGPSSLVVPTCSKKIEVCMGGKCKKLGGGALMEELQRTVGIEGVVSGCKCMGKCRDGPNVKVVDGGAGDDTVRAQVKSLCIGVGLEDVNTIVANFFGEMQSEIQNHGFAVAN